MKITTKREKSTDLVELVETHNLTLALNRLYGSGGWFIRWRRALYHALCMSTCCNDDVRRKVREALELP